MTESDRIWYEANLGSSDETPSELKPGGLSSGYQRFPLGQSRYRSVELNYLKQKVCSLATNINSINDYHYQWMSHPHCWRMRSHSIMQIVSCIFHPVMSIVSHVAFILIQAQLRKTVLRAKSLRSPPRLPRLRGVR
ncbi:hypothetical protein BJY01DRAFT_157512 [Aspergillus pseudoustus]|uniref:Uncharacterized protein n=1 Tax=Aspergillus pseudoustus TaxID=1810923 RepID=A0ABR4IDN3_9EURO